LLQTDIHNTLSTKDKKGSEIKRPKHAWQHFFEVNRARFFEKATGESIEKGKAMLYLATEEWRQLDDKSEYEALARAEKERVRELKKAADMKKGSWGNGMVAKNAWHYFLDDNRARFTKKAREMGLVGGKNVFVAGF